MLNGSERTAAFRKIDSVLRAALMAEVDDCPEAYGISSAAWDSMVEGHTAAANVFAAAFAAAVDMAAGESRVIAAEHSWEGLRESCRTLSRVQEQVVKARKGADER